MDKSSGAFDTKRQKNMRILSFMTIAKKLTGMGVKTLSGNDIWYSSTVKSIFMNEKYKGDARLQKCYTADFLSKKRKANEGEVPQYYVEGSHDAIIEPAEWKLVQMEIQRRKNLGRSHNCCSPFSAKLKCSDCGEYFGSKVWHFNSKYKRTVWQCNAKFKGKANAPCPICTSSGLRSCSWRRLAS